MNSDRREVAEYDDLDIGIEVEDLVMMFSFVILASAMASFVAPMSEVAALQVYEGKPYSKVHNATETLSWLDLIHDYPYSPLMSVFLINDGPDAVEVAVNYPNDRFTVQPNETRTIVRSGAHERIAVIFFKCAEGETATARVEGEY